MVGGVLVSPLWPPFLGVWLLISLYFDYTKQTAKLNIQESRVYNLLIYLYPLLGTLIKIFILTKTLTFTYFWLNRVEHGMWAMALVILLWPAWKSLEGGVSNLVFAILVLSVICLFGNMVEIVEFSFRYFMEVSDATGWYYNDTLFDMISNFFGAGLGILVILKVSKPKIVDKLSQV